MPAVPHPTMALAALILVLAACADSSSTSPNVVRLDTLTPDNGTPGTAVEVTGRMPAGATLHLCGVALADVVLSEPVTAAATHFARAVGTIPNLTPGSTCTLTVIRDGQTLPHTGATPTFTTAAVTPDAPASLSATVGNASVAIDFIVANDGGSPIMLLEYSLDNGTWSIANTSTSPLQLSGLTNEQPMTVRLRVTNAAGTGPSSGPITATPSLWPFATRAGGTAFDSANGVGALADGGAIITGYFQGAATFGGTILASSGGEDVFVAKTNPDGTWAWATSAGGSTGNDGGRAASTLADGSAIITGNFRGPATFGATTLTSTGFSDVFVAKTNPDGSWAWATSAGSDEGEAGSVSTLSDGSAIITGYFMGAGTFGATTLTSVGDFDVFVAKTNPDGTWAWATSAGGTSYDRSAGVSTLTDGSAIITGSFRGAAAFGATSLTSGGGFDVFVAKTDPDGSWAWATSAGGTDNDQAVGVNTLTDGSAIITGSFRGAAAFGATSLTSAGSRDVFVAKTNPDGSWAWATGAGDAASAVASGVSTLSDGSAIITGYFQGAATFGGTTLASAGGEDVFVAKTNPDGTWAWAASAGGSSTAQARGVSALTDGSAIITGSLVDAATFGATDLTSAGGRDVFVAKVNENRAW